MTAWKRKKGDGGVPKRGKGERVEKVLGKYTGASSLTTSQRPPPNRRARAGRRGESRREEGVKKVERESKKKMVWEGEIQKSRRNIHVTRIQKSTQDEKYATEVYRINKNGTLQEYKQLEGILKNTAGHRKVHKDRQ